MGQCVHCSCSKQAHEALFPSPGNNACFNYREALEATTPKAVTAPKVTGGSPAWSRLMDHCNGNTPYSGVFPETSLSNDIHEIDAERSEELATVTAENERLRTVINSYEKCDPEWDAMDFWDCQGRVDTMVIVDAAFQLGLARGSARTTPSNTGEAPDGDS